MFFNVFEAAPENERDGPTQQANQNAGGKVRTLVYSVFHASETDNHYSQATRIFLIGISSAARQLGVSAVVRTYHELYSDASSLGFSTNITLHAYTDSVCTEPRQRRDAHAE